MDDAFIVLRYARKLASGQGYVFSPGAPSDGVTGPLWLFVLAIGVRLGADPVVFAKLVGLGCAVAAQALTLRESFVRSGGRARTPMLVALSASAAPLWIWAVGGLETALATFCTTAMLLGATARPRARVWQVGCCAALIPWLRPELLPLALLSLACSALREPSRARGALLLGLTGLLSVIAFRWCLFAHFLPLSAHAKPASFVRGAAYLLTCLRPVSALALLPLLLLTARVGRSADRMLALALVLQAGVVACAGGDWMAGARLFVPVVPVACLLASVAWGRLWQRRRGVALVVAVLTLGLRGAGAYREASAARAAGRLREQHLPELLLSLQGALDPIAILDIGAVGYESDRSLIDLGGLTEERIAYAPGGHIAKRIDSAWLEARAPGAIVLHSKLPPRIDERGHVRWFAGYPVERHVLAMPWVLRDYRARSVVGYDRDYFYVVLLRDAASTP